MAASDHLHDHRRQFGRTALTRHHGSRAQEPTEDIESAFVYRVSHHRLVGKILRLDPFLRCQRMGRRQDGDDLIAEQRISVDARRFRTFRGNHQIHQAIGQCRQRIEARADAQVEFHLRMFTR